MTPTPRGKCCGISVPCTTFLPARDLFQDRASRKTPRYLSRCTSETSRVVVDRTTHFSDKSRRRGRDGESTDGDFRSKFYIYLYPTCLPILGKRLDLALFRTSLRRNYFSVRQTQISVAKRTRRRNSTRNLFARRHAEKAKGAT